ncbi:hypothetical protein HZI73_08325 [Vallitalea pronyensis]|uniref:Uncharacterized protein n=1 Tax=Vallitalea pronyensis TaxID=1348613 RepID=A0A8J8SGG9_9FIRM|nr:hypothetical protein [Vallitalea pronyensis]QUI22303.1 hypothetical protein HZI73_08325 [Vallitalea pronyensis]
MMQKAYNQIGFDEEQLYGLKSIEVIGIITSNEEQVLRRACFFVLYESSQCLFFLATLQFKGIDVR